MTSIFDGMAGAMNDTFGAPVIYTPVSGSVQTVQATLRTGPTEVAGDDGHPILILSPTLQVPKTILPDIRRGDRVALGADPDKIYKIINRLPNGSPAADAMLICELEDVSE